MYIILKQNDFSYVHEESKIKKDKLKGKRYEKASSDEEVDALLSESHKKKMMKEITDAVIPQIMCDYLQLLKSPIQRAVIDYIKSNHRYSEVQKTSSDQKRGQNVVIEERTYMVLDEGEILPLEYDTVYSFLNAPSLEKKESGEGQKTVGEVIIRALDLDVDALCEAISLSYNCSNSMKRYAMHFIGSSYFKNRITDIFKDYIYRFILTDAKAGFMKMNFYNFYREGCTLCGETPQNIEYLEECNKGFQETIFNAFKRLPYDYSKAENGDIPHNKLDAKMNGINNSLEKQRNTKVPNSERLLNDRLKQLRNLLKKALKYKKFCDKQNKPCLCDIDAILLEIARMEAYRYEFFDILVSLADVTASDACIRDMLWKGLDYAVSYTYVAEGTKEMIRKLIPDSPELEYPQARDIKRHFILHYGPTNSGKTYQAIEALKSAESGIYLGPLRLLALEIQDTLTAAGVLCSLLTGEEEDIVEGASHMASTVEKLDPTEIYDVCVIDEAQMISDTERGYAWTRAILGVQAKEIHVCMAPEALSIVKKLIKLCGDTYEEVEHTRRSTLVVQKRNINVCAKNVEEGDAYIVFSKKKVLQVAADLVKQGVKVSMIYGNLPYPVRKEQVKRFLNGDTQVVVSTNAIGMGINLPVRRIIFLEEKKFNGVEVGPLTITDVKQIAGRAGRNKETGYVASAIGNANEIENKLNEKTPEIKKAYLGFSDVIISIDAPLSDILRVWRSMAPPDMFTRMDIDRFINLNECIYVDVTKKQKLKMISIPFDERNPKLLEQWKGYCIAVEQGKQVLERPSLTKNSLQDLEQYCQELDLWYSFSRNFGYEINFEWLRKEKSDTSEKINDILIKDAAMFQKRCECCGKPMHWSNPYKTCQKCYIKESRYYN